MSVAYTSHVTIEKEDGPIRVARLPADAEVRFGVHGAIAEHYGVPDGAFDQHAATLDYVVAAAGG